VTGPVWDGEGQDPWLPARLDAMLNAAEAERTVYEAVWEALSAWLVTTTRRIMAGPVPDPEAIFSQVPAWKRAIDQIITTAILPVMSWAYEGIFGPGYDWREHPSVVAYLIGVKNRLVRTPDEVFNLVSGQLAAGVTLGEGIPQLTARIDQALSLTDTERWPNRAVTIARTEALGALNSSRTDAFNTFAAEDEGDTQYERMWLATIDDRTRLTHREADGQRVAVADPFMVGGFPLAFPGDPAGPPQEVIQCVPADTRVELAAIRAITRRWFEGEMIRLRYSTGDVLTITPNHPILRSDGRWAPAGLINEGDYCVHGSFGGKAVGQPYKYAVPPQIGELYRAACEAESPDRIRLSPPDFHGDGSDGEVEVVPVQGQLRFDGEPASEEQIEQCGFSLSHLAGLTHSSGDGWPFTLWVTRGEVDDLPSTLGIRGSSHPTALFPARPLRPDQIRLACGPACQAELVKSPDYNRTADPHCSCDGEDAFPVDVTLAQVIQVERFDFRGHVFNLDTGVGWYIANGIAVRNCRCTSLLLEAGETVNLARRQLTRR
jgi:hypothetical protein